MKKNTKIALAIIIGGVIFSAVVYVVFRLYFTNNPIVLCGDDKYSTGCLVKYATDLNLAKKPFIDCVNGNSTDNVIAEDVNAGTALQLASGPALFVGQITDNTNFTGFFVSVSTYTELKAVEDNVLNKGLTFAETENLKTTTEKINANVKQYLDGQGFTGDKYNQELAKIQPDVDKYLASFKMFNIQMKMNSIRGNADSKVAILYFADYGSQYTSSINSILLAPAIADYVDGGKAALVVKEWPESSDLTDSKKLAAAALCAGVQQKYFEYTDFLSTL